MGNWLFRKRAVLLISWGNRCCGYDLSPDPGSNYTDSPSWSEALCVNKNLAQKSPDFSRFFFPRHLASMHLGICLKRFFPAKMDSVSVNGLLSQLSGADRWRKSNMGSPPLRSTHFLILKRCVQRSVCVASSSSSTLTASFALSGSTNKLAAQAGNAEVWMSRSSWPFLLQTVLLFCLDPGSGWQTPVRNLRRSRSGGVPRVWQPTHWVLVHVVGASADRKTAFRCHCMPKPGLFSDAAVLRFVSFLGCDWVRELEDALDALLPAGEFWYHQRCWESARTLGVWSLRKDRRWRRRCDTQEWFGDRHRESSRGYLLVLPFWEEASVCWNCEGVSGRNPLCAQARCPRWSGRLWTHLWPLRRPQHGALDDQHPSKQACLLPATVTKQRPSWSASGSFDWPPCGSEVRSGHKRWVWHASLLSCIQWTWPCRKMGRSAMWSTNHNAGVSFSTSCWECTYGLLDHDRRSASSQHLESNTWRSAACALCYHRSSAQISARRDHLSFAGESWKCSGWQLSTSLYQRIVL